MVHSWQNSQDLQHSRVELRTRPELHRTIMGLRQWSITAPQDPRTVRLLYGLHQTKAQMAQSRQNSLDLQRSEALSSAGMSYAAWSGRQRSITALQDPLLAAMYAAQSFCPVFRWGNKCRYHLGYRHDAEERGKAS